MFTRVTNGDGLTRPRGAIVAALLIASFSLGSQASDAGGDAYLVRNINAASEGVRPAAMTSFAGSALFVAGSSQWPRHLWKSDGTATGTAPLADLECSSYAEFVEFSGSLFIGTGGNWCAALWKTDGTPEGTIKIWDSQARDSSSAARRALRGASGPPDALMQFFAVESLTVAGSLLFFVADRYPHGQELWRSDGTEQGTALVRDIWRGSDGSYPTGLTAVGARLFFTADDGKHGRELWSSDGTERGTLLVRDLAAGSGSAFPPPYQETELQALGSTLYFVAEGDAGYGLWSSKGTAETTLLLLGMWNDHRNRLGALTTFGRWLLLGGCERQKRCGLWRTDGTRNGTRPVRRGLEVDHLTVHAGQVFFSGCERSLGCELWRTDGTESGTLPLADVLAGPEGSYPSSLTTVGDWLYFVANDGINGREIWRSDGTTRGTALVADLRPGPAGSKADHLVGSGSALFFFADDGWHGLELCRVGREGRARMVAELETREASSNPDSLAAAGGRLFFVADDGWHGRELWTSDGTAAGTYLVADIWPGFDTSGPTPLADLGGSLYFSAYDDVHGGELRRSDGTPRGTALVRDIRPGPYGSGVGGYDYEPEVASTSRLLFFPANDGTHGFELWRSDGTQAGTSMVRDISPGAGHSNPKNLTAVERQVFFTAGPNPPHEKQLWKSDGTAAGTLLVKTLVSPDPERYWWVGATEAFEGSLFFLINDEVDTCFWISDGTERGTREIRCDLRVSQIVRAGDALFLGRGTGLWHSDGTSEGTRQLRHPSGRQLEVGEMVALANTLLFVETGQEYGANQIWRSDGTELGTRMVSDIQPGGIADIENLTVVGHLAYFVAWDGEQEGIWRTDGTADGTWMVQEFTGFYYLWHLRPTPAGGSLFFSAWDDVFGAELWALPLSDPRTPGNPAAPGCSGDERVLRSVCRHRLRLKLAGAPGQAFRVRLSDGRRQRSVLGEDGRATVSFRRMERGAGKARIVWGCGVSASVEYRCR